MYRPFAFPARSLVLAVTVTSFLPACGGGGTAATTDSASATASDSTASAGPTTVAGLPAPASSAAAVDSSASSILQPIVLPAVTHATTDQTVAAAAAAVPTDAAGSRALEVSYLNSVVPPELMDYSHLEVAATTDLESMSDGSGPFLGLRTYHGQPLVNSGVRAEVSVDYPYVQGQTLRYSWRFGILNGFTSDSPSNRWWMFGDWHDQPDPNLGQTWATYVPHSPSVGLGYGQIKGQDYLALLYGAPNPTTVGLIPFSRGVWHTMVAEITWSQGANGHVALYLDGSKTPVQQATGANMYNNYQHYLKLGTYRQPDILGDTWVYVRDVKIQTLS